MSELLLASRLRCRTSLADPEMKPPSGERFRELVDSIRHQGLKNPIYVDKDMLVISGHYRLLACRVLGKKDVPVVVVKDLDEFKKLKF